MTQIAGQLRFTPDLHAVTEMTPILSYKSVDFASSSTDSTSFVDFIIAPSGEQFIQNRDYYLRLQIPQDLNYTLSFDVQLIKQGTSSEEVYQHIKTVSIPRGGNGENTYHVVLYEDTTGQVKSMIPKKYVPGVVGVKDEIYYDESTGYYWICNNGSSYTRWTKFNSIIATASWKEETTVNYGLFEMIFTPIDSGFTHILIKMIRTAEDYSIQRVASDGNIEYGRKVDISLVKTTLYILNNLVPKITTTGLINRIGVWGHPGMLMAINGEEIRITRNGYYELDDFAIERLCIVAADNDYTSFFTVDYTYDDGEG